MMRSRVLVRSFAVVLSFLSAVYFSEAVIFTENTTIQETNDLYEGAGLLISNCTVTVLGIHHFSAVDIVARGTVDVYGTCTMYALTADGATLRLGGGHVLGISTALSLSNGSTLLVCGTNTSAKVDGAWAGLGGMIQAADVSVSSDSTISANGQGYTGGVNAANGNGPGAGVRGEYNGPGASHGAIHAGGALQFADRSGDAHVAERHNDSQKA